MNTEIKVAEWSRKMGYEGKIPGSLKNACNSQSAFIWNQLMQSVRPKPEVDHIRKNLIVKRLSKSSENKPVDEPSYTIKQIEIYQNKKSLENAVYVLENSIKEKKILVHSLSQKNKLIYSNIENHKNKKKQNNERQFLLNQKSNMLKTNIAEAEESLTNIKNLTPVEMDENPNMQEITETLKKCAEKLQELIKDLPPDRSNNLRNSTMKQQQIVNKYLHTSIKKPPVSNSNLSKIVPGQENVCPNIKRSLFTLEGNKTKIPPVKKGRESLGILPDTCFNNSGDDFLLDDYFKQSPTPKVQVQEYSPQDKLSLSCLHTNPTRAKPPVEIAYNNDLVVNSLKRVLTIYNRPLIYNYLQNSLEKLIASFDNNALLESTKLEGHPNMITHLQFIHVQTEIRSMKHAANKKKLQSLIDKRKEELVNALKAGQIISKETIQKQMDIFMLKLEDLGLDAAINYTKKQFEYEPHMLIDKELLFVVKKLSIAKDNIDKTINSIKVYLDQIEKTVEEISTTREEATNLVQRMSQFFSDFYWAQPLTEDIATLELTKFKEFPLEYNRQFTNECGTFYYRDRCTSVVDPDTNPDDLYIISNIIDCLSTPETILLRLLHDLTRVKNLKALQPPKIPQSQTASNQCPIKELNSLGKYVQCAVDEFKTIMYSDKSEAVLAFPNKVKQIMTLWREMSYKNYISPQRLVDGHTYSFYEEKFDCLLKS